MQCDVSGRDGLHRRRCHDGSGTLRPAAPPYGWFKACTEIRDYRKQHPNDWIDTGLDNMTKKMDASTANTLYGIGCAYNFVALNIATSGVGLIPAAYIIFKK